MPYTILIGARPELMHPFTEQFWSSEPADSRCQCTWAYAPSYGGPETPWGIKFGHANCPIRAHRIAKANSRKGKLNAHARN